MKERKTSCLSKDSSFCGLEDVSSRENISIQRRKSGKRLLSLGDTETSFFLSHLSTVFIILRLICNRDLLLSRLDDDTRLEHEDVSISVITAGIGWHILVVVSSACKTPKTGVIKSARMRRMNMFHVLWIPAFIAEKKVCMTLIVSLSLNDVSLLQEWSSSSVVASVNQGYALWLSMRSTERREVRYVLYEEKRKDFKTN